MIFGKCIQVAVRTIKVGLEEFVLLCRIITHRTTFFFNNSTLEKIKLKGHGRMH